MMTEDAPFDTEARLKWLEAEISQLHHRVIELQGANLDRLNAWRRDQILMGHRDANGLKAFNGQLSKLECFLGIFALLPRRLAIETGTFVGWTTQFLANQFDHVVSFEAHNGHREEAIEYCRAQRNISFAHGDSAKMKEAWRDIEADLLQVDFAYLDAHWYEHCPLREELVFVLDNAPNAVVFVDDFRVQDDEDYGYDVAPSMVMELSAVADILRAREVSLFFPARPGVRDTSMNDDHQKPRGTLIIVPNAIAPQLRSVSVLRPVPTALLSGVNPESPGPDDPPDPQS